LLDARLGLFEESFGFPFFGVTFKNKGVNLFAEVIADIGDQKSPDILRIDVLP
jgi:hypothetical protein